MESRRERAGVGPRLGMVAWHAGTSLVALVAFAAVPWIVLRGSPIWLNMLLAAAVACGAALGLTRLGGRWVPHWALVLLLFLGMTGLSSELVQSGALPESAGSGLLIASGLLLLRDGVSTPRGEVRVFLRERPLAEPAWAAAALLVLAVLFGPVVAALPAWTEPALGSAALGLFLFGLSTWPARRWPQLALTLCGATGASSLYLGTDSAGLRVAVMIGLPWAVAVVVQRGSSGELTVNSEQ